MGTGHSLFGMFSFDGRKNDEKITKIDFDNFADLMHEQTSQKKNA